MSFFLFYNSIIRQRKEKQTTNKKKEAHSCFHLAKDNTKLILIFIIIYTENMNKKNVYEEESCAK